MPACLPARLPAPYCTERTSGISPGVADDQEPLPPGHSAAAGQGGPDAAAAPSLIMWRVPSDDATISAGLEKIFISERDILIHLIRKGGPLSEGGKRLPSNNRTK